MNNLYKAYREAVSDTEEFLEREKKGVLWRQKWLQKRKGKEARHDTIISSSLGRSNDFVGHIHI